MINLTNGNQAGEHGRSVLFRIHLELIESRRMPRPSQAALSLAESVTAQIKEILLEAEREIRPLEIDPYRGRLFELFVTAEGAGFTCDGAEPDLSCDGIGRSLAMEWNLQSAASESVTNQSRISPEHLGKLRLLWSFMRMWMEWTYAWERYCEFKFPSSSESSSDEPTAEWRELRETE